jgi:DNA-binding FadR family transcriptional regulator
MAVGGHGRDRTVTGSPMRKNNKAPVDVTAVLNEFIQGLQLGEQSRLPPERELAQALGVSRTHLRTGLRRLEAEERIWRHVGKGTFVGSRPQIFSDVSAIADLTSPREIIEARLIFEPELARLAAFRATRRHFDQMAECVRSGGDALDREVFYKWDSRFHRLIANAAGNALLVALYEALALRHKAVWGKLRELFLTPERMRLYTRQHDAILEALSDRDGNRARSLMIEHLQAIQENVFA